MGINLITATQTIAPAMGRTVLATLKKERKHEGLPTDDPGYKETLNLVRELIHFTAINAVEDIQHLTTGWVPHPPSAIVTDVEIPNRFYDISARHIQSNLGPKNLDLIGKTWWQWRRPNSVVRAEWVEMKADYLERKANNDPGKKVMFYIHGGAYFFGGIAHGPQTQRHARKLKGRVFAPRYRLAPHFPFPCAVQDILSAYLYLLTIEDPSSIVIAGDSAGGGLCMALLLILRDEGLPLPAGASLISPWVDLTHSFPSITIPTDLDYVPSHGFHSKPSLSWPPPTVEEMKILNWPVHPGAVPDFEMEIKGEKVALKDQIQLYAQNNHLQIPLVSPICAASLGGLCPLQVIVGGGEVLRDEQIYLAHKAANPSQYPPSDELLERNGNTMDDVTKYPPTDVQLLIFEGCPHAAPTLGHTRGAKYQYRSISQFAAWALAKAQGGDIEIDDSASIDSFWDSSSPTSGEASIDVGQVGKAGDPLPQFQDHMIRLHVNRFGKLFPLKPASELRACTFPREEVGWPKASALKGWMKYNDAASKKFASQKQKVWEQRLKYSKIGYINDFPNGEVPPPTALAGRRVIGQEIEREKPRGKMGKGIVGLFFGKLQHEPKIPRQDSLKLADAPKRKSKRVSYMPPPVAKDPHDQLPPIPQEDYREFLSEDLPEDLPEQQQEKPQQDVQEDLQEMGVVHAASNDVRKIRVITGNFELPIASTFTSDEKDYGVDSAISVSPRL